jgi:hypothetical protein
MFILDSGGPKTDKQADIFSTALVLSSYLYSLVKFLAQHLNRNRLLYIAIFGITIVLLCLYRVAEQMLSRQTTNPTGEPEIQGRLNFGLLGEPKEEGQDASY